MAILEKLFITLILLLPLGQVLKFQLGGNVSLLINDLIVFLIGTVFVFLLLKKKAKVKKSPLDRPILIFILTLILSLSLATFWLKPQELFVSLLYLLRLISYIAIFFVVKSFNKEFVKSIPRYMLISGGVFVFLGFLQYFLYNDLRNLFYLGWDEHLYRLFSTFLDPNFTGIFIVLYLIFSLSLYATTKNNDRTRVALFLIISLISALAVFLTYSRTGLLMMILTVGLFLLSSGRRKIFFAILLISVITVFLLPRSFQTEGTNLLRRASIDARLISFDNTLEIVARNPIFGVGFNAFRYAQIRDGYLTNSNDTSNSGAGTDNSYLFIAATSGIFGLLSFIYLGLAIVKRSLYMDRRKRFIGLSVFLSIIGLSFASLFINAFLYVFILEWIVIQLGIMENS